MTSTTGFASVGLLWLLLASYLVWAGVWLWCHFRGRGSALRYSAVAWLRHLKPAWTLQARRLVQMLRLVSVLLLVLAVARPQTGRKQTQVWSQGVDIMLAIDTSGSMRALDLDTDQPIARRRTRLQVVKDVVAAFAQKREADQVGMVVFGGQAFTQCPLTLDHAIITAFLDHVEIGMAGDTTAIGSGLATAVNRLRKSKAKSKVIILLTDGSNNAGDLTPKKAAEVAKAYGIKVYTIGAGNRGPAPFVEDTVFGKQVQYYQLDIDEPTLKEIATITGGAYFRAEDSKALAGIYNRIDALEKTEIEMKSFTEYEENFVFFVIPAVVLLLLEIVLLGSRLRKLP